MMVKVLVDHVQLKYELKCTSSVAGIEDLSCFIAFNFFDT